MKTTFTPYPSIRLFLTAYLPVSFCLSSGEAVQAQAKVSAVFTHSTTASVSTTYTGTGATGNAPSGFSGNNYNYQFGPVVATPNLTILDSFTAVGLNYHLITPTPVVKFRRVDNASVTGLRKSLWFELSSSASINPNGTAKMIPAYDDSLERIFGVGNIFNVGIDNNFQNAATTNNNNIERVDFMLSAGASSTDGTKAGFVVFDRGPGAAHDSFYVAAIKTLDASGNPSSYYNAVTVAPANYGSNIGGSLNYLILRKNPADAKLLMMNNTNSQNRDGVFLTFADLGVANNSPVYGYSLFGDDVVVSPASNLVNYNNSTNFPTNSDYNNGGLDQLAISGLWVTNTSYIVLADRLSDFSANLSGTKVQIGWALNEADGLTSLVVERSGDGKNFQELLDFYSPATGHQTAVDESPLTGNNYYRMKWIDQDGSVGGYSAVSQVTVPQDVPSINLAIYPDPVINRHFTLNGQGLKNENYDLRLLDMNGHVLYRQSLAGSPVFSKDIDLPATLPYGLYMIGLTDKKGNRVFVKTIIVR